MAWIVFNAAPSDYFHAGGKAIGEFNNFALEDETLEANDKFHAYDRRISVSG